MIALPVVSSPSHSIKLLTENSKLRKIPGVAGPAWRLKGLAISPARTSGREVCPWRTAGCSAVCNGLFSGGNNMPNTRRAMIDRAQYYFGDRPAFLAQLARELAAFYRDSARKGYRPAVRLNVSSDIVWERVAPEVFAEFPGIQFYDYTKAAVRHRPELPANYTLSHSIGEGTTVADIAAAVAAGRNVVAAFNSSYVWGKHVNKKGYLPRRVSVVDRSGVVDAFVLDCVNGDRHDLRLPVADGRGRCVALRGKGGRKLVAAGTAAGFILDFPAGAPLRNADMLRGTATLAR
jgi:hypothetical protein